MPDEPNTFLKTLGQFLSRLGGAAARGSAQGVRMASAGMIRLRVTLILIAVAIGLGLLAWKFPPIQSVDRGEIAVRSNQLTGRVTQFGSGSFWAIRGLQEVRRFSTRDQVYRPERSAKANGEAPFQSVEGLSLGVDLSVRYAIDPTRIAVFSKTLPEDIACEVVEPAVQGVIYRLLASYTVKEIFSTKRAEIQQRIESELKPQLAADGILLRGVQMGQVDLPQDYRTGMDKMLAEELESEKMRYTLELTEKRVKQTELEGEADKVRRQKSAEAAAQEEVIAAQAQEEAMKHVLPFKEKQVQQRTLEAEAEKVARIRTAEGSAEARRIEAAGEADSRQKLADAEVYRLEHINQVTSAQMEREGELIAKNPLLIQKTMADKLSDKVQVIIAAPPAQGGFIGSNLLGSK
jgi:regulator of protease activity HflC (stomatin/prohibitin superfamily)